VTWIKCPSPSHELLKSWDDTRAIASSSVRKTLDVSKTLSRHIQGLIMSERHRSRMRVSWHYSVLCLELPAQAIFGLRYVRTESKDFCIRSLSFLCTIADAFFN